MFIKNIWQHIRNLEDYLGLEHLSYDQVDDPQDYYHWLRWSW